VVAHRADSAVEVQRYTIFAEAVHLDCAVAQWRSISYSLTNIAIFHTMNVVWVPGWRQAIRLRERPSGEAAASPYKVEIMVVAVC
jgi:hypothetical protein